MIAAANGYQIAVEQDNKSGLRRHLHIGWLQLEHDYDRLWSHTHDDDAETCFERCLERSANCLKQRPRK
jgi:hypothetical protein